MIELSETLIYAVLALFALAISLVIIAIVAIPQYFKHAEKASDADAERQRMNAFNEIIHKAQLADVARDCIAGKETAWTDTDDDKKPSA